MLLNELATKKITEQDTAWKDWAAVAVLWAIALGCFATSTLDWEKYSRHRLACSGASVVAAILAIGKIRSIEEKAFLLSQRRVMRRDYVTEQSLGAGMLETKQTQLELERKNAIIELEHQRQLDRIIGQYQGASLPPVQGPETVIQDSTVIQEPEPQAVGIPQIEGYYNWDDLPDENTGIMIAGNAGSGKTSVCCWVLGKLTEHDPATIEVLDPHGGINKIWGELGLTVLCEYDEIEARLAAAIAELDARRRRSKLGEPVGPPYIFVCDELDSCFDNFQDPELISKAIKRLGKEGRKYDLSLIFISHSSNVGAKGIDAQERNCYVNIYLGGTTHAVCKYTYKEHDWERQEIQNTAYPCMVSSGGLPPVPAYHPTHGHHPKFKKKGNAPANLLPIRQLENEPQEPPEETEGETYHEEPEQPPSDPRAQLEALFKKDGCPECGSLNVRNNGTTGAGTPRKRCNDCGKSWAAK